MEEKLKNWLSISKTLSRVKKREVELRREICSELFNGKIGEFKHKEVIGEFEVEAQSKINRKVDPITVSAIWEILSNSEKACVRFKPELNLSQYRKLPEDSQLHEAVTETPSATPVLKVKAIL